MNQTSDKLPPVPAKKFAVEVRRDLSYGPFGARNLLDVYLPANKAKRRPAVVFIHGGGWRGGDKGKFAWYADDLAQRGIAAFSITYRFWPTACYPAAIEDAQLAVRWVRAHAGEFGIDPEKIGGIGDSAGGHLGALLALRSQPFGKAPLLSKFSSSLQCMVDVFGPVDFPAMMSSASRPLVEGFMNRPFPAARAMYEEASATSYVSEKAPPFLIVHGTEDVGVSPGQVPISISASLYVKLRMAGVPANFIAIEGAGHGFLGDYQGRAAKQTWKAALPFFAKCLC